MEWPSPSTYAAAGVDVEGVDVGLRRLAERVRRTWPAGGGVGSVQLDLGYYANVIDVGGIGLAITTDGVGTKVLVAQRAGRYDTIGVDCVAMNVNDLLCVGATPLCLVDYLAVGRADPDLLDALAAGLCRGAELAGVSIVGGEIAQVRDILREGQDGGHAFDIAATAVGTVPLDRILVGQEVCEGDALIGVESNGIHSNGFSLARQVLLDVPSRGVQARLPGLETTVGEELLRPTHIYVREALAVLSAGLGVKALMHVTGDGWLNLSRVAAPVGFVAERLPPPPPIFAVIQRLGAVPNEEMFRVFNMGIGFCFVAPPEAAERVVAIVEAHGKRAWPLGHAVADTQRRVWVRPLRLVSRGKAFIGE